MELLLFHEIDDDKAAESLEKRLQALDIRTVRYCVEKSWTMGSGAWIGELLRTGTHLLVVLNPEVLKSAWFGFVFGYFQGKNAHIYLYLDSPKLLVPEHLSSVDHTADPERLFFFYSVERKEWQRRFKIEQARKTLDELGFSRTDESFCAIVAKGSTDIARLYLEAGLSANARNAAGTPLLSVAARNQRLDLAVLLCEWGAEIDATATDRESTALMDAAAEGAAELIGELIRRRAPLNRKNRDGQTALILAAGRGFSDIVDILLAAGADPDIQDKLGMDALQYATLFKHEAILERLRCVKAS